jgi:hypothetical protein
MYFSIRHLQLYQKNIKKLTLLEHELPPMPTTADMSQHASNKTTWPLCYYLIHTKTKCINNFNKFKIIINTVNSSILFKLKKRGQPRCFKRLCRLYDVLYAFRGLETSGSVFSSSVADRTIASIASCYVGRMSHDISIYSVFHGPEFYAST